jgi:hypothetical protein
MMDIKDFYLRTPMKRPEYMRLKITDIPEEIIEQYKLKSSVTPDGYVYILKSQEECTAYLKRES